MTRTPAFPVTTVLGVLIAGGMVATQVHGGWHASLVDAAGVTWEDVREGRLWRGPLSALVQEDAGIVAGIVVLLGALPLCELRWGPARTLLAFVAADFVATFGVLVSADVFSDVVADPNLGSSAGLFGALGAAIAWRRDPVVRRAAQAAVLALLLAALWFHHDLADTQHLVGAATGTVLGTRWRRALTPGCSPRGRSPARS